MESNFLRQFPSLMGSASFLSKSSADYQWFASDYAPTSVLSSLFDADSSAGHLSLYDDDDDLVMSKEFEDEELAEIEMESFCREDIHNLLLNKNRRGSCALVTSSIYRPLFSPVPESTVPAVHHLSQDSLDMSTYPEEDIVLTCNKHNYTIAFEGSFIGSEASFYVEGNNNVSALEQRKRELLQDLERRRRKANIKMSSSEFNLTTWSNLKKTHNSSNLNRFLAPRSGEEGAKRNAMTSSGINPIEGGHKFVFRRTRSLSNLTDGGGQAGSVAGKLNVSQVIMDNMDQAEEQNKMFSLLPNCAIPMHHSQQKQPQSRGVAVQDSHLLMKSEENGSSSSTTTTSNNNPGNTQSGIDRQQPSFNLVKLFIKQKSNSTDTCMDVSSGCWPSDSSSHQSFDQQQQLQSQQAQNVNANIQNRNYFRRVPANMARHEEENEVDSLDPLLNNNNINNNNNNSSTEKVIEEGARNNVDPLEKNNNRINNLINNNHMSDSSEEHNITQIYNNLRNKGGSGNKTNQKQQKQQQHLRRRLDTITRSMQTSIPKLITSATMASNGCGDGSVLSSHRVNIVPTSFLRQLQQSERRGDGGIAPVYVIYPNYTLPNLDFVSKHDVILSPMDYRESFVNTAKLGAISKVRPGRNQEQRLPKENVPKQRPKSFNDILSGGGKRTKFDYKNISDWRSLIVLLPVEYARILRSIPDIEKQLEGLPEDLEDDGFGEGDHQQQHMESALTNSQSQKQMFCQTTPVMRRKLARPLSCDCTAYVMQTSTSSSSSNQPASSGYRGSSTILTDSELGGVGLEAEEETSGLPPTHCGRTPKGILRRNFNRSRVKLQQVKRNSMFDDGRGDTKVQDKRRSLQEFPTQQYYENIQLAAQETEDFDGPPPGQGLSPLLNYKQTATRQPSIENANDLSGVNRFRKKLSTELEALEMLETRNIPDDLTALAYDRLKLRNDVSRALSNQPKRVSFSESESQELDSEGTVIGAQQQPQSLVTQGKPQLMVVPQGAAFTTPPNSPNISVMAAAQKKRAKQTEQERIQSNRFKRLQIQWELLSKDSESLLKDMEETVVPKMETKSGGSTPTGPQRISRIPRPISYPSSRIPEMVGGKGGVGGGRSGGVAMRPNTATATTTPKKAGFVTSPTGNTPRGVGNNSKLGIKKTNATTTNRFVPKAR